MFRPLILFAILAAVPASNTFGQEEFQRTWRAGKFEIVGSVKSLTEDEIVLKTKTRDSVIAIDQLSQQDRSFLEGLQIIEDDAKQFDLVVTIIEKYERAPMDGIEYLIELGQKEKYSPYAPFAAGVALATLKGDFKAAKRQFAFAKAAIQRNQKVLGKGFHAKTEAAINNNIGVCLIKQFKADDAVEPFLLAIGKGSPSILARHNRDILLDVSDLSSSQLDVGKRGRKTLLNSQINDDGENLRAFHLPNRYLISTAWQNPLSELDLSELLETGELTMDTPNARRLAFGNQHSIDTLQEIDAYPDLWCTDCRGTGMFTCRDCINGRVETRTKKFAGNSPNGSGPMYQWVSEWVRCSTCLGKNHRRCEYCNQGKLLLDR